MAEILRGAPVADAIVQRLIPKVERLNTIGVTPRLAIVRVGESASQLVYQRNAQRMLERVGAKAECFTLADSCTQADLVSLIQEINCRKDLHGCLILRPLPAHMDELAVCASLRPEKDVDGITPASLYAVFTGTAGGYPPCTPEACLELLDHYGVELEGKSIVVIGRSLVVGRSLAMLLQVRNATVTLCHSHSRDLPGLCRPADIIISAAGSPGLISGEYLFPGQAVIDVGINTVQGRLCGDVRFDEAESIVRCLSPVPGGIGSVTSAILAKHLVDSAEKSAESG